MHGNNIIACTRKTTLKLHAFLIRESVENIVLVLGIPNHSHIIDILFVDRTSESCSKNLDIRAILTIEPTSCFKTRNSLKVL
jgi:hypothetical protein